MSIPRLPIIALRPNPWFGRRLNAQHILSRLAARGWPVVYSTGGFHLWERHTRRWAEAKWLTSFIQSEGVWIEQPGRFPPRWERWRGWDRLAIRNQTKQLRDRAGNPSKFICYVFHPEFWPHVEYLNPRYVVFHAYDAFKLMPDWTAELETQQQQLLERADLRIVTFGGITQFYPDHLRRSVRELPNGVDSARFVITKTDCPPDLAAIPHPRLGYAGTINPKVNFDLLFQVAQSRGDWNWVFIGRDDLNTAPNGEFATCQRTWRALRSLPNVHYLGCKDFEEVPKYALHMDVNTICYRTSADGWWSFGSPNKLHEALAVGRPVVATPIASILPFSEVVDIADSAEGWMRALERAVSRGGVGTPETRRQVAIENSWDRRVDVLEGWLFEMVSCRSR